MKLLMFILLSITLIQQAFAEKPKTDFLFDHVDYDNCLFAAEHGKELWKERRGKQVLIYVIHDSKMYKMHIYDETQDMICLVSTNQP